MTVELNFTPAAIMEMGYQRIKAIADRHGMSSPETLAACERWGGILDDVNYPDSTCRWCGHPVNFVKDVRAYYHTDTNSKHCREVAAGVAEPRLARAAQERGTNWQLGDSEPVERPDYGVGGVRKPLPVTQRPPRKVIKK